MPKIAPIPRDERRLVQKAIHITHDKNYARKLTAMLMLHRGARVSDVARTLCCARFSVGRWINRFTLSGVEGLESLPAGRSCRWPFEHICSLLRELVKYSPGDFGYQRSRWSTELLAVKINKITGCQLHRRSYLELAMPASGTKPYFSDDLHFGVRIAGKERAILAKYICKYPCKKNHQLLERLCTPTSAVGTFRTLLNL